MPYTLEAMNVWKFRHEPTLKVGSLFQSLLELGWVGGSQWFGSCRSDGPPGQREEVSVDVLVPYLAQFHLSSITCPVSSSPVFVKMLGPDVSRAVSLLRCFHRLLKVLLLHLK